MNSSPLQSCVSLAQQFMAGHGIRFYDKEGNEIAEAQAKFQEWMKDASEEEFLHRVTYDLAHGLGASMQVRRSATGDIVALDHLDRFGLRSGKMKSAKVNGVTTKKVLEYYWSSDWSAYMRNRSVENEPRMIPAYIFGEGAPKYPIAAIFNCDYRPREPYYGRLFWMITFGAKPVSICVLLYRSTRLHVCAAM